MAKKSGASKTDTVVKLALVFFISLLSFTLGTYVGKQVSDSEYQTAKYDAEDYKQFRKDASLNEGEHQAAHNSGLSEEEINSLTEEFVNKDKGSKRDVASAHAIEPEHGHDKAAQHKDGYSHMSKNKPGAGHHEDKAHGENNAHHGHDKKAEHPQPAAHPPKKSAQAPMSKEANRVAAGLSPTKDAKPKRQQASAFPSVATSSIGKFTVQVASYATEQEAKDRALKLRNKGFEAFYIPANVKGRQWFRVSVGLFDSQKSANTFKSTLMKQAHLKSAFVQKIVK